MNVFIDIDHLKNLLQICTQFDASRNQWSEVTAEASQFMQGRIRRKDCPKGPMAGSANAVLALMALGWFCESCL
jgi:hypothetical protein